jgi:protein ImuA
MVLEMSGNPGAYDLVASRKLNFAASETGVTAILLHEGADCFPSAAQTRWHVAAAPSDDADDWGLPSFTAELARNRQGPTGIWTMTWSPEDGLFRECARQQHAPYPGTVAAASFDRPVEESRQRRAQQSEKRRIAF